MSQTKSCVVGKGGLEAEKGNPEFQGKRQNKGEMETS